MDRRTRGRSRAGRLRLLDGWLVGAEAELLTRRDGIWAEASVVDLGIGSDPSSTLELARAVRGLDEAMDVVGIDIDPDRVRVAARTHPGVRFLQGGFDARVERPVRLLRAMNVLRQYDSDRVQPAHDRMLAALLPGGLLVEGSSDRSGTALAAWLLRREPSGRMQRRLLLACDLSRGFSPDLFRGVLPRDAWGRRDHPACRFLDRWREAWLQTRTADPAASFRLSTTALPAGEAASPAPGILVWSAN